MNNTTTFSESIPTKLANADAVAIAFGVVGFVIALISIIFSIYSYCKQSKISLKQITISSEQTSLQNEQTSLQIKQTSMQDQQNKLEQFNVTTAKITYTLDVMQEFQSNDRLRLCLWILDGGYKGFE